MRNAAADTTVTRSRFLLPLAALVLVAALPATAQTVVFDQGPTTGTYGGCWLNQTTGQNFADRATFSSPTKITAVIIYTCTGPLVGTVHVKILSNNGSGAPGSVLYAEDKTPDAWVVDAPSGGYKITVELTTPFIADAGVTYWYGVSGNAGDISQDSVLSPGDGHMAMFGGSTYSSSVDVGDQMFQLEGQPAEAIPALDSWGFAALALLVAVAGLLFIRRSL